MRSQEKIPRRPKHVPALVALATVGLLLAFAAPAGATLSEGTRAAELFPDLPAMWPLLIGAWKRKPGGLA